MPAWVLAFAGLTAATTWLARAYALKRDLVDHPGDRRSHAVPTPRGGGVAIVLALLVAVAILAMRDPAQVGLMLAFATGLMLVAGVGLLDDHRPLSVRVRLAVHVLASVGWAAALQVAFGNPWVALLAGIAALVLINVWNFMDGINGIAASQAALLGVASCIGLIGAWGLLGLALAAACVGFLPFNFPRARVFLGDVGSGAIGFCVAALLAVQAAGQPKPALWLLIPCSAFLVDAGLTLLRRMRRGERWWTPHTQHAYQVWARKSGHATVTLAYAVWTAAGVALAAVVAATSTLFMSSIAIAWYMSAALIWWTVQGMRPRASGSLNKDSE